MKKYIYIIGLMLFTLCGCDTNLNNTPTRQAEIFLGKYQTLHQDILDDLDNAIKNDTRLDSDTGEQYRSIMKKHYQDLEYEILEEKIDGDRAIVTVKIEIDDYRNIDAKAREMYNNRQTEDETNNNDDTIINNDTTNDNDILIYDFMKYRLDAMKNNKDRIIYTIDLTFTKKDKKWVIDPLSDEIINKINGIYA